MSVREINFASYNGRDTIQGWIYTPILKPRAIVQIVHGLNEHSRRYTHMIYRMLDAGFVVCADDHAAHGKTAADSDTWGDSGDKGWLTAIEDEHTLRKITEDAFPGLPFVIFGHSWGSMITRAYTALHGSGVKAAIYCGAVARQKGMEPRYQKLKAAIEAGKGGEPGIELTDTESASIAYRYENPADPNAWLAVDPAVGADYASDPFNNLNHPLTNQFLYDFTELYRFTESEDWAAKVPIDLPVYLIAGDQDPVGNFGEGVYHTANALWDTGHRFVKTQVYSGFRHEIHNEPAIRNEVADGVIAFIDKALESCS
ncbi:MAG: lysophospholipase [Peptococcaceae bacterium]|jgi:alpha-beta hydrolase superfamily lysophospholipase|nr:lysophospholipase [Peptococcaceae bacterium]